MKILITSKSFGKYDPKARHSLQEAGFELIDNPYSHIMDETEFSNAIKNIDCIILGTEILNQQVLKNANQLKFVSRYGVGIDNMDLNEMQKRNIKYATTPNCNNRAVADYTIGLIIDALRGISYSSRKLANGQWEKVVGLDLYKKTVGIIGLGAIGKEVAKRLSGFTCNILGYDIFYNDDVCKKLNIKISSLEEIYYKSDIITLHIPALPDDKFLIGSREIANMKDGVVIINTARASLINMKDLLEGIKEGKIFAAASDAQLNLNQISNEYVNADKLILTPHNGAVSIEASRKMSDLAAINILNHFQIEHR